jgi:hypothetical protein
MKKIKVLKSVEGGVFQPVVMDEKLFSALGRYNKANESFNFLFMNGIIKIDDTAFNGIQKIIQECEMIFKVYDLDKYDVRANYLFEKAERVAI